MALEADRLSFSYGEVPVLSCASFGLPQGGFAALIGPNGAGKSTLLKLLLGELSPSSGAVRLLGQDTARFRNWRRLGYVPQDGLARHTDFPASVGRSFWPTCPGRSACSASRGRSTGSGCGRPWNWWEWPAMGAG